MSAVTSSLSKDQQKKLLSLFDHARLHLLYKASIHGFTAAAFHARCDRQGSTVTVAYNATGFVFGGYISKDYSQSGQAVRDEKAFLYSISAEREKPLRVAGIHQKPAFTDGNTGPHFGSLVFLHGNQPAVLSSPGTSFHFQPAEMHGNNLVLTEFELYRVEGLGDLLPKPWRNIHWTSAKRGQLMETIQSYKPDIKTVTQVRVLLVGAVGAGKSSFFNSINSAFRGHMTCQAMTGTAGTSVTSQFGTYSIMEDALGYRKHVTLSDKIHCLAYVVDTCKVSLLSPKMLDKFAAIRKKANQLGIPQIILMTKVDEACPHVAEDLKNVYQSVYVQQKARQLSESLGIPLSYVLPVKNYCAELELDHNTDILLFMALEQMLNYADSFFENQVKDDQDDELYSSDDHSCAKT